MSRIVVEKIHPASIQLDNKVNKYVNKIREKYIGGSNGTAFFSPKVETTNAYMEAPVYIDTVDNKNENDSRFYYLSALTSLGIQFGTIIYWYFSS
jgi:hypothetical protein